MTESRLRRSPVSSASVASSAASARSKFTVALASLVSLMEHDPLARDRRAQRRFGRVQPHEVNGEQRRRVLRQLDHPRPILGRRSRGLDGEVYVRPRPMVASGSRAEQDDTLDRRDRRQPVRQPRHRRMPSRPVRHATRRSIGRQVVAHGAAFSRLHERTATKCGSRTCWLGGARR
jgi:hypothetical protein